jgi:acetylornithine deacetylase/succinyl-diaminopimelate desuccinylase-like protein
MRQPESVVGLASELVRIPSVNPDGDPGTDKVGEKACAEYLAEFLKSIGAETELREVKPDRPNVIGKFPTNKSGKPRLLFAPHTDTVSVIGMVIDPFSGEVRDGKLWGRGSSDTKGPMASMLWALKEMGPDIASLSHEIWFAGLMGEEASQFGSISLASQEKFDFVMAGEPTSLDAVYRSKGSIWFVLSIGGKAVHGATPELGDNAIYKMADIVRFLRDEIVPELSSYADPILGAPSLSVGIIHGGSKTNIVPDLCTIQVDMRLTPRAREKNFPQNLQKRIGERWPDARFEKVQNIAPLNTPGDLPLLGKLQSLGSKLAGAPWFSDAGHFSAAGSPSIAIGPGSIQQAHTKDEFIEVSELERGAEFFTRFLQSLK